jgi:hypothetical protein
MTKEVKKIRWTTEERQPDATLHGVPSLKQPCCDLHGEITKNG